MPTSLSSPFFSATVDNKHCGGPLDLSVNGSTILTSLSSKLNLNVTDITWPAKTCRVYHKAGTSILETTPNTPDAPVPQQQTSRFAANSARITWDIKWSKATQVKHPVQLGIAVLAGKWTKLYTVPRTGKPFWSHLEPGAKISFDQGYPLSLVLEREDGVRFEYSFGFDLWRWDYALGMPNSKPLEVLVEADKTTITPQLCDPTAEDVFPEGRQYRFMATIAWSSPELPSKPSHQHPVRLPFNAKGADLELTGIDKEAGCYLIDFAQMPVIEVAKRKTEDGRSMFCLENNNVLTAVKRTIRQVAAMSSGGHLILAGLTPGICMDGSHCEKKGDRIHWDHQSILAFAAWAKNCLGPSWTLDFPQPDEWAELPSLAYLHLPNGFDY